MAASNELEIATEVKCEPHKLFKMIKHTFHHLPTVFPEVFKSTDILEGDGESVGSVRLWKYVLPGATDVRVAKEKTEIVDDENMWVVLNIFEGNLVDEYSSFLMKVHVIPHGDGSTIKWSLEYGNCGDGVSHPHHYLESFAMINKKLESYFAAQA